ncbi:Uncharacterised protein [Bordetella pertussis]|nr:Uncharacterised protein [Bordetella pertussis]
MRQVGRRRQPVSLEQPAQPGDQAGAFAGGRCVDRLRFGVRRACDACGCLGIECGHG